MTTSVTLHEDRLLPSEPSVRAIARRLYREVSDLPIISPHGHTDPAWFADDEPFADPASLLIVPDHYVFRMLYSQGVALEDLGVPARDGRRVERDPRAIFLRFAERWHLFRGTPTRMWIEQALHDVFGIRDRLSAQTAHGIYDQIADALRRPELRPRALFERFKIEVLSTTESPLDPLRHHQKLRASGWSGRIVPTYRPDPVVDPEFPEFADQVAQLGALTGEDIARWPGYLRALADRRRFFASLGATATDHGHPSAATFDLSNLEAEQFRGQMLTEMARMSLDDGLVMQLHPGALRNHNPAVLAGFGRDKGADIPTPTDYVRGLKPLLDRFGNEPRLTLILFTLDESTYSRELAPLAGHYPILRLGPPWWFYDSPEGMRHFRERATETAGFYNTVGFNDDTRALLSIPGRHDVARRMDCGFLAQLVADHRLDEDEAREVAVDLAYRLAKRAYRLDERLR